MNTKNLNKEDTIKAIDLLKKRISFNNKLNASVRKYRKENNISRNTFNGYWDEPTKEMREFIESKLEEQTWMPEDMKNMYRGQTSGIMGQVYSCAVNTYVLNDLHDCERHLETLTNAEQAENEETEYFRVERDINENRLNLYFDDIPEYEVRSMLKSNGFKWSPSREAWTRQLTDKAEMSLKRLLRDLDNYNNK